MSFFVFSILVLCLELYAQVDWSVSPFAPPSAEKPAAQNPVPETKGPSYVPYYMVDSRDGEKYKIVMIGKKVWMAENLRFYAPGSECLELNQKSCERFGRYYTWAQAVGTTPNCNQNVCKLIYETNFRGICPDGWHIPTDSDWIHLTTYVNSKSKGRGAEVLKSTYAWKGGNGTNESNFNALPSGFRFMNGNFLDVGWKTRFWSITQINETQAASWELSKSRSGLVQVEDYKSNELPLRCIRND